MQQSVIHHRGWAPVIAFWVMVVCLTGPSIGRAAAPPRGQSPQNAPAPLTPEQRVFQLLHTLKNAPDADQREQAAEALANFDSVRFFEIVPALINTLQRDSDKSVRRACVSALADLKPTSDEVLQALTEAAEKDAYWRVRWAARSAKRGYKVEQQQMVPQVRNEPKVSTSAPLSVPPLAAPELPPVMTDKAAEKAMVHDDASKKTKWFRLDFWRQSEKPKEETIIMPTLPSTNKPKSKESKPILQAPPLPS